MWFWNCEYIFLVSGLLQTISKIHSVQKRGKKRKTTKNTNLKFIEIKRCPHTGIKSSVKYYFINTIHNNHSCLKIGKALNWYFLIKITGKRITNKQRATSKKKKIQKINEDNKGKIIISIVFIHLYVISTMYLLILIIMYFLKKDKKL